MNADPRTPIPPHNLDAEHAVLGAILLEGARALERAAGRLRPEDFYTEAHSTIFRQILALRDADRGIDLITVCDALRAAGELDQVGGPAKLAQLEADGSIAAHLEAYVQIVLRDAGEREKIQLFTHAIGRCFNGGASPAEITEQLARIVERTDPEAATQDPHRLVRPKPLAEALAMTVRALETDLPEFIATPIAGVNMRLGGGLLGGELCYLGAGPGIGKTALALEWAVHAGQRGDGVLVFSREMKLPALTRRILAQQAKVGASTLRKGDLDLWEWQRIRQAVPRLAQLPVWLTDEALSIRQIKRAVRAFVGTVRLVIVDYLQLLKGPGGLKDRRLEIDAISYELKTLAMRFDMAVVCLSAIRRPPPEKRGGKLQRPTHRDLRESSGLEHDGDVVLLLHRPDPHANEVELIIDKARDGQVGIVPLEFTPTYLRFLEITPRAEP